jgi:hypothetical protein
VGPLEAAVAVVDAVAIALGAVLVKWGGAAPEPARSSPAKPLKLLAEDIAWACNKGNHRGGIVMSKKLFIVTFSGETVNIRPDHRALQAAYPDLSDFDRETLLGRAARAEAEQRSIDVGGDRRSIYLSLGTFREHPDLPEALRARYAQLLEEAQAERARLAEALGDPRSPQTPTDSGEDGEGPAPRFEPYDPDKEREKIRQAIDEMLKRKGG